MREFEQHLSPDLMHRLVEAGESDKRAPELVSAAQHVAACAVCRQRLEQFRTAQRGLDDLKLMVGKEQVKSADCPPEPEWANVAAGLVEGTEAAARVDHAARCAYCGPLLREAMEDLAAEPSDEDRRVLGLLPSAQQENQQRLAARLASADAAAGRERSSRRFWVWGIVGAAAAALALAAFLLYGRFANPYGSAEKLLAQAYTANRELDLRIPGAAYAPLSTVRGANTSQPLPLLRAEVLIDRQLAAHPNSAAWVALQGRAQLLQGNFDEARSTLQQALRLDPNSPAILTDLATAEYALSEQEGRSEQSMSAAEHLSEALKLRPDDPVALYNRALVYESIGSLPLALKDWERYLRLDPSSAWATEVAREHLDHLKKRLGSSPQSELPPSDPAAAAAWLANRLKQPAPPAGTMDSADEQSLDVAVTRWLPDAYASATSPAQRKADRTALDLLAKELVKRHGDHWLEAVLATPSSTSLASGLAALAQAVQFNEEGRADEGQKQAARAASLLRRANSPAALRAEAELAYAYQRETSHSRRCADAAQSALRSLGRLRYGWIEAQLQLELSACEAMLWHLGASRASILRAVEVARSSGYGTLYLRGIGFLAGIATAVGDYRGEWRQDRIGLENYWRGLYPPMRAYQFYGDMVFGAEAAGDWLVAEGLAKESIETIAKTRNRPMEAEARFRLATLADFAGDQTVAREEFQRAAQIFGSLPSDPTVETYEDDCQIYLADLEVQTGAAHRALARLRRMSPLVQKVSDNGNAPLYFRGLGEAYLAAGQIENAENSLLKAVSIAERGLLSLRNENERASWVRWYAGAYRSLARAELKGRGDPTSALGVWEWYRSGIARIQGGATSSSARLLPLAPISVGASDASDVGKFRAFLKAWIGSLRKGLQRETVVSYAQFFDGIQIWAFDNRGISSRWVPVQKTEFDQVARRFGQECADPESDLTLLRSDGRHLYQWLIAPVKSQLSPNRILAFETDGAIRGIPMQALVDAKGEYLGDQYAVVFSPGLGYQSVLRRQTLITPSTRVLAVGAPALGGEWRSMFAPLPDANGEVRAVAADFRSTTLLTGEQATLQAVLHDLPNAEILHFAGHALAEGKWTGLVLAAEPGNGPAEHGTDGAGMLAASRLDRRELRECRLAVLSACSTASGGGAAPVDPESLVGAFLLAGVPDVVASRWDVNSVVTLALMRVLYRRLLAGDPVAVALQRAEASVRQDRDSAHPYFWAAFSAYGN